MLLLAAALMLIGASCKGGGDEKIYFASPMNKIVNDGKWEDIPLEICRYTGGDTYTTAYTFPDTERYIYTVFEDTLYYTAEKGGGEVKRVDLKSGAAEVYARFEYESAGYIAANKRGVYVFCKPSAEGEACLYKLTKTAAEPISENAAGTQSAVLNGDELFFIQKGDDENRLMHYGTETGKITDLAKCGEGRLFYGSGYVYIAGEKCRRINTETGEEQFVGRGGEYSAHDGWVYYSDRVFCRYDKDDGEVEIMRRNLDTGVVETCGKTYIPYLGAISFADSIEFGKKGFIIYCTERKERTEYMYFKYGEYGGTWLTPQTP